MAKIIGVPDSDGNLGTLLAIRGSQELVLSRLILTGGRKGLAVEAGSVVQGDIIRAEGNLENGVVVSDHSSLTLWDGGVVGNGSDTEGTLAAGIFVTRASSLSLLGKTPWFPEISGHELFDISGNRGSGIYVERSWLYIGGGVHIHDNLGVYIPGRLSGAGIFAIDTRLDIGCWTGDENVIRGNPVGVFLREGSQMSMYQSNTVRHNATVGVGITGGSRAVFWELGGHVTIEGNPVAGVEVTEHSHGGFYGHNRVRGNGSPTEPLRAGIRVDGTSQVFVEGGTEVTGNTGPGMVVDINSSLDITDATVAHNQEEGIRLLHMSIARIQGATDTATNGDGPLSCDPSSMAISSLVLKGAKCANLENVKGSKPKTTLTAPPTTEMETIIQRARSISESFKEPR